MADSTEAAKPKGGKKIMGQPAWMWAVGAGVVVVGYILLKRKPAAAPAQHPPAYQSPTGWSTETMTRWLGDWQGQPRPPRTHIIPIGKPKKKKQDDSGSDNGGGGGDGGGDGGGHHHRHHHHHGGGGGG